LLLFTSVDGNVRAKLGQYSYFVVPELSLFQAVGSVQIYTPMCKTGSEPFSVVVPSLEVGYVILGR
jgi:hypothetical protein